MARFERKFIEEQIEAFNEKSKEKMKRNPQAHSFVMPEGVFIAALEADFDFDTVYGVWFVSKYLPTTNEAGDDLSKTIYSIKAM